MRDDTPHWLPRVALAETCSGEVLALAAASAGVELFPEEVPGLLATMDAEGLLDRSATDAAPAVLRPEAREAMLAALDETDAGRAGVRCELLAAGVTRPAGALGPQLAQWAREAGDWGGLAKVWESHPSSSLVTDARTRDTYASVPPELRSRFPQLSFAEAMSSAYDPDADRLDFDRMMSALIRDGLSLHADWAHKPTTEAQVVSGTIRMLAQATVPESTQDPRLEGPSTTYDELSRVILNASVSGDGVSAKALTFFHSTASLVALLRGDWSRAWREGEFAMIVADLCALPGFLAALVVASASALSGNTQHSSVADRFLASHAEQGCRTRAWVDPAFHLVKAEAAIRHLDRQEATERLRLRSVEGPTRRWFDTRAMHAALTSTAAILWEDPQRALAQFDSIVTDVRHEPGNAWRARMLRCRAELLIALGEMNRAEQAINELLAHETDAVSAAPAAWFYLCTGNFAGALAKADAGIFELSIPLVDRAFLYAVKAAALHQAGAPEQLVASAASAACELCERADTLVPFAALPSAVRSHLLARHDRHHGGDCFVGRAQQRDAFAGLRNSAVVALAPVRLTPREKVLLPLLATSATVQEIADQQFVSVNTVRKQVMALREKVGASSRSELIRRAHQLGLLGQPDSQPLPDPAHR